MHKNYIYILHFYYNFRVQLINDAIIEVDCYMDDEDIVNIAADVILALMPRFGQDRMRGIHAISSQPNPTPMPGPCG